MLYSKIHSSQNLTLIHQNIELQTTYTNFKNTLQQIAQKIGDVEQESEEHKYETF